MKKSFFAFLLALSLIGGVAEAYYDGGSVNRKEESGGSVSDPVRVLQLVRFPEIKDIGVALTQGEVVVWDVISDDGVTVNRTNAVGLTASNDAVAGVVVSSTIPTADIVGTAVTEMGRRNWGYIQTYGYCPTVMINTSNGSVTAGQGLRAAAADGYAVGVTGTGGGTANGSLGFAYDAVSSGSAAEAFIRTR